MSKSGKNRLRASFITSTVSIALVLFMLGTMGIMILYGNRLSKIIKENITVSLYLKQGTSTEQVDNLVKKLKTKPYIKNTEYISSEQAATFLADDLGEDFVKFIGYNPLPSSIDVHLVANYANSDSLALIQTELMKLENIEEVAYQKILLDEVNSNIRKISFIFLSFSIILLIISVILISNTIKLSIYSKRFLIRSMQLVGATEKFVRTPFIKQGIWQGFIAAILALIFISIAIMILSNRIGGFANLLSMPEFVIFGVIILLFGFIISIFATWSSVNKFLRMRVDKLYTN